MTEDEWTDEVNERWAAAVAAARVRFRTDELVGMTVPEARAVVLAAGGTFATDQEPITVDVRRDRVIAFIVNGRVDHTSIS